MSITKTYYSLGAFPLSVDIPTEGGGCVTFDFKGGFRQPSFKAPTCRTSNKEEQELLESYSMFKVSYDVKDNFEPEVVVKKEDIPQLKEMVFENVNAAKDFLAAPPYNIAKNKMGLMQALLNRATECGFIFKFETVKN
jgi:hypothetical protein